MKHASVQETRLEVDDCKCVDHPQQTTVGPNPRIIGIPRCCSKDLAEEVGFRSRSKDVPEEAGVRACSKQHPEEVGFRSCSEDVPEEVRCRSRSNDLSEEVGVRSRSKGLTEEVRFRSHSKDFPANIFVLIEEDANPNPNPNPSLDRVHDAADDQQPKPGVRRLLLVCIVGGALSALWAPVSVWASKSRGIGPYQCMFCFNFGQLLVIPFILIPVKMKGQLLQWGSTKQQFGAICAGTINVVGLIAMFIAGEAASFAVAFGILQCSPLVAAFWGIYFGELRGASGKRLLCFSMMIFTYVLAIVGIAMSQA